MKVTTKKEIKIRIEKALDEIRPYLAEDGGNIDLIDVTDKLIVKVRLKGACSSCSVSGQTMKNGVESVIMTAVPEVKEVLEV